MGESCMYIRDLFGDSMQYLIPRRRLKMSKDFYTLAIDITGGWALGCGGSCGVAVAVGSPEVHPKSFGLPVGVHLGTCGLPGPGRPYVHSDLT